LCERLWRAAAPEIARPSTAAAIILTWRLQLTRLPHVPELITSDRLELRAPALEHVVALTEAVRDSLSELAMWMPWATDDYDEAGAEENVRGAIAAFVTRADFRYHMFDAAGRLVGSSGLHRMKWSVPRFEIGYWLRTGETGKGYASEAVRALATVCFEELGARRLDIRCDDTNLASAAVAERCGFHLEGVLENYSVGTDGTVRNERVYALTRLADLR